MKTTFNIITLFLMGSLSAQVQSSEQNFTGSISNKKPAVPNIAAKPGFRIYNGVEYPVVIIINEGKSYTISDGIFNGEKKLFDLKELEKKLNSITNETNTYSNCMILVSNSKPYLVAVIKNESKKTKETIIIQLAEENNYLKMKGCPVKKVTILGKTTIKIYSELENSPSEYVGHLILMK